MSAVNIIFVPIFNTKKIYLSIAIVSSIIWLMGIASFAQEKGTSLEKKSIGTAQDGSSTKEAESDTIPHLVDWRAISLDADKLIDKRRYAEAEKMLISILQRAKAEAPESVDYALTLCRLSTDLYLQKKYQAASERVQEAIAILNNKPSSPRQHKVTWRAMLIKTAILIAVDKNIEAESLSRKAVAYAIAFPEAASTNQLKIAYSLLKNSLVKQGKAEEAKKVSETINSL